MMMTTMMMSNLAPDHRMSRSRMGCSRATGEPALYWPEMQATLRHNTCITTRGHSKGLNGTDRHSKSCSSR
jgi:hypothetical protein